MKDKERHEKTEKSLSEAVTKMQTEDPIVAWVKKNVANKPTTADQIAELWHKNESEIKHLNRYDAVLRQLYDEAIRKVTVIK